MIPDIDQLLVDKNQSLAEVLRVINENAQGICFVTDEEKKLVGIITDGDIRRALLNGYDLRATAGDIMFTQYTSYPVGTPKEILLGKLNAKIRHIPLLNEHGQPVDYACLHRYNRFPVSEPLLSGNELEYVTNCIKTNWISSAGKYVRDFETMVADYCRVPYALAVSNGTVALHLALDTLGIGKGDEVIVPDLTFAASINAIIYTGATPVIVDIERDTWNIDPKKVAEAITPKTKAIMPVHLYGLPAKMEEINAIAKAHQLLVIEDAAEAIGSSYRGQMAGSMSDAATFSFYGNKTITTGEGGMILFKDKAVFEKAAVLRDHGMSKDKRYWHNYVGYNYRLTNLQAAIGVAQMERVHDIVAKKIRIAQQYISGLADSDLFQLQATMENTINTYWLFTVLLQENNDISRDELIAKLQKNGIETRPAFYPLHVMPPYQQYVRPGQTFEQSDYVSRQGICLPSYLELRDEEVSLICSILKQQRLAVFS
jgi:perosamine synthetase